MRILLVAPWGRALAAVLATGLREAGAQVLVVTSPRHYEATANDPKVLVVTGSARRPRSWATVVAALRTARAFDPDVVVAEEFADPRLLPMLRLAPLAVIVHDDAPHDQTETAPWRRRIVATHVQSRAALLLTFSRFVAAQLTGRSARVAVLPLPSEIPAHLVPPVVVAERRRDMVVLGRINPYKDVPTTLAAWSKHVAGPAYRGDQLIIIGDGSQADLSLPPRCTWRRERFQFAEVVPTLAAAKASLVHYRSATQSGVQVSSMQCGTTAVASDAGGLAEYLPPGQSPVPAGDVLALCAELDRLADPVAAAAGGRASRTHHDGHYRAEPVGRALLAELVQLAVENLR